MSVQSLSLGQQQLVEQNLRLVYHVLHRFARGKPDVMDAWDDYVAVGQLALCQAARTYRPDRSKFSTWAVVCIENALRSERQLRAARHVREKPSFALPTEAVFLDEVEGMDVRQWLAKATASMSGGDREVLAVYMACLGGRSPVADTAAYLARPVGEVREAIARIRSHLRAYAETHGGWT